MSSVMELMTRVDRTITLAVAQNSEASVDEIVQHVKTMIDEAGEGRGWLNLLPVEHLKNLVRKKVKENELLLYPNDPQGRDDAIRRELQAIRQDIARTRPEFAIMEMPFCPN